jgi:hypothetical protein
MVIAPDPADVEMLEPARTPLRAIVPEADETPTELPDRAPVMVREPDASETTGAVPVTGYVWAPPAIETLPDPDETEADEPASGETDTTVP